MTLHFCLTLDEDGRWRLVDDSNCEWELGLYYKLAGGKCKYLLYVASADAGSKYCKCFKAKKVKVMTSLINRTQQGQGAH